MERDEIIKDLECCKFGKEEAKCKECNWHPWIKPRCWRLLASNALSLIKELTEENERLKATKYMAYSDGRIEMIPTVESVKADTVRKMHSMLCEGRVSNDNVVIVANQIAKEMLEGSDESI